RASLPLPPPNWWPTTPPTTPPATVPTMLWPRFCTGTWMGRMVSTTPHSWHCAAAEAGLAAGLGVPPAAGAAEATFAGAAPAAGWPGWGSDVAAWPAG